MEKNFVEFVGNLNPFVFMWEPNDNCRVSDFQVVPNTSSVWRRLTIKNLKFHINKNKIEKLFIGVNS